MGYNQTTRAAIEAAIKTPADPKIKGDALQTYLLAILDAVDSGAIFMGPASLDTVPNTTANCFYLATTTGTYANFIKANGQAISLVDGEKAILSSFTTQENQNIRWTKSSIVTPADPNGFVAYAVAQALTPQERATALGNIGAATADGENPNLIAGDIMAKSENATITADENFNIHTTADDNDIKNGPSYLESIRGNIDGKLTPFMADTFVSTGMNLVNPEQVLTISGRTAYYFPIAKGTWGAYGTTQENNGYIVVGDTPYAVHYSPNKPTVADYGSALTPVISNGKSYYTTTGYGWLVVIMNDGSETPAVHIAWSNYKDEIGGVFGNTTKRIAPFVQWIHAWGMGGLYGQEYAVFDEINVRLQKCFRRIDRAALNAQSWSMETVASSDQETQTTTYSYVFTATLNDMRSGGLYRSSLYGLEVNGNVLTYRSDDITTVPDFLVFLGSSLIYYEKNAVVEATFASIGADLTVDNISNDFGLTYFMQEGEIAGVIALVTETFKQGGKDQLFNAVTYLKILAEVLSAVLCQHDARLESIEKGRKTIECTNLFVRRRASIPGWNEVDAAPASASAPGEPGDYFVGSEYLYVCVSSNTWKRSALSTF